MNLTKQEYWKETIGLNFAYINPDKDGLAELFFYISAENFNKAQNQLEFINALSGLGLYSDLISHNNQIKFKSNPFLQGKVVLESYQHWDIVLEKSISGKTNVFQVIGNTFPEEGFIINGTIVELNTQANVVIIQLNTDLQTLEYSGELSVLSFAENVKYLDNNEVIADFQLNLEYPTDKKVGEKCIFILNGFNTKKLKTTKIKIDIL